ncbi:MAG: hypothetical protein QM820_01035 [Minicystis sp.]
MVKLSKEQVACFVCGAEGEHEIASEAQQTEPPDLDTRPGEALRSTLKWWVQRCPSCGYCAPSIAEGAPAATRVVATAAYKALLDDPDRPELANRFLASAASLERAGLLADAAWQVVYAAWACDDEAREEAAAACREHAIEMVRRVRAAGSVVTEQPGEDLVVEADLLRRAGRFDEASALCEEAIAGGRAAGQEALLVYEQTLALRRDQGRRTIAEAESWRASRH